MKKENKTKVTSFRPDEDVYHIIQASPNKAQLINHAIRMLIGKQIQCQVCGKVIKVQ